MSPRSPPPGSAAGAARHYNLRLPTEGLRQGTRAGRQWPAPGLKGYPPHAADPMCLYSMDFPGLFWQRVSTSSGCMRPKQSPFGQTAGI